MSSICCLCLMKNKEFSNKNGTQLSLFDEKEGNFPIRTDTVIFIWWKEGNFPIRTEHSYLYFMKKKEIFHWEWNKVIFIWWKRRKFSNKNGTRLSLFDEKEGNFPIRTEHCFFLFDEKEGNFNIRSEAEHCFQRHCYEQRLMTASLMYCATEWQTCTVKPARKDTFKKRTPTLWTFFYLSYIF